MVHKRRMMDENELVDTFSYVYHRRMHDKSKLCMKLISLSHRFCKEVHHRTTYCALQIWRSHVVLRPHKHLKQLHPQYTCQARALVLLDLGRTASYYLRDGHFGCPLSPLAFSVFFNPNRSHMHNAY